jgi:hypothetical protein
MAKLPPHQDKPTEAWAYTEEASVSETELSDTSEAIKKNLDNSFDEYFLSQEGLLPEWVDG